MKYTFILLCVIIDNVMADHDIIHTTDNVMIVPVIEVLDGDTIRSSLLLPSPLNKISIRLLGIDTPESTWRAKCEKEKILGLKAKQFLKSYMEPHKYMKLAGFKYGTYAGRILANVSVNGIDLATMLIEKGYAKFFDGRIKPNWCNY